MGIVYSGRLRFLAVVLIAVTSCVLLVLVWVGGAVDERDAIDPVNDENVSDSWIRNSVQLHVLARVMADEEPAVVRSLSESPPFGVGYEEGQAVRDVLVDGGVLRQGGGGYSVVLSENEWIPGQSDELYDQIDFSLSVIDVEICDSGLSLSDFSDAYVDRFSGRYSNSNEYKESIEDYVNCGSGDV